MIKIPKKLLEDRGIDFSKVILLDIGVYYTWEYDDDAYVQLYVSTPGRFFHVLSHSSIWHSKNTSTNIKSKVADLIIDAGLYSYLDLYTKEQVDIFTSYC